MKVTPDVVNYQISRRSMTLFYPNSIDLSPYYTLPRKSHGQKTFPLFIIDGPSLVPVSEFSWETAIKAMLCFSPMNNSSKYSNYPNKLVYEFDIIPGDFPNVKITTSFQPEKIIRVYFTFQKGVNKATIFISGIPCEPIKEGDSLSYKLVQISPTNFQVKFLNHKKEETCQLNKFVLSFKGSPTLTHTRRSLFFDFHPIIEQFFSHLFDFRDGKFSHIPDDCFFLIDNLSYIHIVRDIQEKVRPTFDASNFLKEHGGLIFYQNQANINDPNVCKFSILDIFKQKNKDESIRVMNQLEEKLDDSSPFIPSFEIPLGSYSLNDSGISDSDTLNFQSNSVSNPQLIFNSQQNFENHDISTNLTNSNLNPSISENLSSNHIHSNKIPNISKADPLRSFVYIASEAPSILRHAFDSKNSVHHNYIHFEIDASFKVTRPYIYSVPRVESYFATIPLGLVIVPTESCEMYQTFFKCLQFALEKYNKKAPENCQVNLDLKNDVFFLSDKGSGNIAFYTKCNLHYGICTRHVLGSIGPNSPLCQIAQKMLQIHEINEWVEQRESYFQELKKLYQSFIGTNPKEANVIQDFAREMQLSNDLLNDINAQPFNESMAEELHELPIARDFSPDVTNGPEGAHGYYNTISMKYALEHRIIKLLIKINREIEKKKWYGPYLKRVNDLKRDNPESYAQICPFSCYFSTQNQGIFGVPFCPHTAAYFAQRPIPNYMRFFPFEKSFPWENSNVFYLGKGTTWCVNKRAARLYIYHKRIAEHAYTCLPQDYYFVRCLKGLLYYTIKQFDNYDRPINQNEIITKVSCVLSKHFTQTSSKNSKGQEITYFTPILSDFKLHASSQYAVMKQQIDVLNYMDLESIQNSSPIFVRVTNICKDSLIFCHKEFGPNKQKQTKITKPILALMDPQSPNDLENE